jgi:response regulator of citrate/malate metabolism
MADAMKSSTKVMQSANKAMNLQKVQQTMTQFAQQNQMLDMREEMSNNYYDYNNNNNNNNNNNDTYYKYDNYVMSL